MNCTVHITYCNVCVFCLFVCLLVTTRFVYGKEAGEGGDSGIRPRVDFLMIRLDASRVLFQRFAYSNPVFYEQATEQTWRTKHSKQARSNVVGIVVISSRWIFSEWSGTWERMKMRLINRMKP